MTLEKIIDYIETNLFNAIDYDELAKNVYTNKFNIMRVFSAATDYTLAEYVRTRRLSEAGKIICESHKKIIDIAFDCGYSSAESFSKAFKVFNGFSPSECRKNQKYRYAPKICVKKIGKIMEYEIIFFDKFSFIGFGKRFYGKSDNRLLQDENFITTTRKLQDALRLLRSESDVDWWEVLDNFDESGYDVFCSVVAENLFFDFGKLASRAKEEKFDNVFSAKQLKDIVKTFVKYDINGKYAKFVSEYKDFPMGMLDDFTKNVYDGIDEYGFVRDETRPELLKIHWTKRADIHERHLELYLPVN